MRICVRLSSAGIRLMADFGCSDRKVVPVGLQTSASGDVFICAPKLVNPPGLPPGERSALHHRIAQELPQPGTKPGRVATTSMDTLLAGRADWRHRWNGTPQREQ